MLIYEGVKNSFLQDVDNDLLAPELKKKVYEKMGRYTSDSEYRSWAESMVFMYKVMNDKEIPDDAGIAIEYNVPQTDKRVDFIISGYNDEEKPGVIIIELKQWDKVEKVDNSALVETYTGHALRKVVHPSYQAWSYAKLIKDYNSTVQDLDIDINPCSYLHNYIRKDNDPLDDEQYKVFTDAAPAYTNGQVYDLRKFIKKTVKKGDNKEILYEIDHGKIRPSKSLQDSIRSMIEGNQEFIMIDEQRVVYDEIIRLSELCQKDHKKRTVICQGGPGTGKSVVAVQLLAELTQRGQFVQYVSKNMAPRTVYLEKLKGMKRLTGVENLFKGSSGYVEIGNNQINTLIVDEAHRLELKSQYTKDNGNNNQIREIIHASRCSVFFIDESQRVTLKDIGTIEEIERLAKEEGSEIYHMELLSQFRCNGSNGYLAWIDNVLEIRDTANHNLNGIDYDFRIFDNPHELRRAIVEKNRISRKARLVAGYCWNWPKSTQNDPDYHDIVIDDFEMSWNLSGGEAFALDEKSIDYAGCIHTTQGLEFDYIGVIIGNDMRYEDNHILTDFTKRANTDQSIKGLKKMYREKPEEALKIADEIIKNTYRTLMTRGMKGCYIYCTDKALSEYLKRRI